MLLSAVPNPLEAIQWSKIFFLIFSAISAVNQFYESQVYDIYVIRGNAAVFKCHIPSFVSDHVQVVSWHDTEGGEYTLNENYGINFIVNRAPYNVLILLDSKYLDTYSFWCSFFSVFSVVSQAYTVNLVDENVLRGNAAILKCLIPSFVSEYVVIDSWIISEDNNEKEIKMRDTLPEMGIHCLIQNIEY